MEDIDTYIVYVLETNIRTISFLFNKPISSSK